MTTTLDTRTRAAPVATASAHPAEIAKAALRRLVLTKLEPTPENYARAYRAEAGLAPRPERAQAVLERIVAAATPQADAAQRKSLTQALLDARWDVAERDFDALAPGEAQAASLAGLIESIVHGIERGGRQWTAGRRKESLQRVLAGSRADPQLLQHRLAQLVASWDGDATPLTEGEAGAVPGPAAEPGAAEPDWSRAVLRLSAGMVAALGDGGDQAQALDGALKALLADGPTAAHLGALDRACADAERSVQHRGRLVEQLGALCLELTAGLGDLAEDDSWAQGQVSAMRQTLEGGITARGVRSASEVLRRTREHQVKLRDERAQARDALKGLINQMLQELGELGSRTGRFHESVGRYAEVIDRAESLESLTGVVGEMLEETRGVQEIVGQTQQRLQAEHARASDLSERVIELESELRRLSEEVSTDQLTQIANRRGLMQAFETARAQAERDGAPLAIGLLDVDNFKRLNDELGHSAGDVALRTLAGVISKSLRPADVVARFGGEEFVVLLPATQIAEGEQILTRLQRSLSVGLFMHERKTVFVTFSAGVTIYRPGEAIEPALERADEALYEAKRTGKNRTCIA